MSTDTATDETGVTGDAAEDADELIDELERRRSLRGLAGMAVIVIAVAFSAFQLWLAARGFTFSFSLPLLGEITLGSLQSLQVNSIHVTFGLLLTFLLFPATQGDGFLSRRLARIVPALETWLGETNPVTRGARGVRGVIRWLLLDPERERVTPVDILLMIVSILSTLYILLDFDEVQLLRSLGLDSGQTIAELVPVLSAPVDALSAIGIPLDETSAAFVLGALGVLLVLEATRRTLGFYLMSIVTLFIVYARFGYLIPGDAPIVGVLGQIRRVRGRPSSRTSGTTPPTASSASRFG